MAEARTIVVVSGPPAAGKTTLAHPLARKLGLPLLTKDTIKETLFDALGHLDADLRTSSKKLGGAAMELLWRLAVEHRAVMLEANFRGASAYERERLLALTDRPIEVHCVVPTEVAVARYADRGARADHHQVHVDRTIAAEVLAEFVPFGLGPLLRVDTTGAVNLDEVAEWVWARISP